MRGRKGGKRRGSGGDRAGGRMVEGRGERKGGGEDPLETSLVGSAMSTMAILLCAAVPSLLVCMRVRAGQGAKQACNRQAESMVDRHLGTLREWSIGMSAA
jgi:hypothetical protein